MMILTQNGNIMAQAPNIVFGVFEGEEKWKLSDENNVILYYYKDADFTLVENVTLPDDFDYGKYLYQNGEFVLNPDYIPPALPIDAQVTAINEIASIVFVVLAENETIDSVTASEHIDVFSDWEANQHYTVNNLRKYNGTLYKCILEHDALVSWTPDVSPSLWVRTSDPAEEWPEWSQPIGATDAYSLGDKVSHNNQHWVSNVNANTWEPGVYGWDLVPEA